MMQYGGAVMFRGVKCLIEYIQSVARIFCVFMIALFLPRVFLRYVDHQHRVGAVSFKLGLENVSQKFLRSLTAKNDLSYSVALITNQTGKDQYGRRNIDLLLNHGVKIKKIFTPHHGLHGDKAAGKEAVTGCDSATNIPIICMYGNKGSRLLNAQNLRDIDVLMFDVQDSGMRHYGYITALVEVMQIAARQKKTVVVLDRPNLLGNTMEGSLIVPKTNARVPHPPIPIRHGMTVGELARYFNQHVLHKQVNLRIVPMENYMRYAQAYRPLISRLSPNIASISSCYGYSFLGLLGEVAPFDIGVGTDKAFQCILLPDSVNIPKQKWYECKIILKNLGIESSFYRYFSKRKKTNCSGLRLHIKDINNFSSFNTLLAMLDFFKNSGVSMKFSHYFDKAIGTTKVRELIQGTIERKEFEDTVNTQLRAFFDKARDSFIYNPLPKVVTV